jgi:uncharacterized protein
VKRALRLAARLAGVVFLAASLDALAAPTATTPPSAFDRGRLFRIDRDGLPASYVYGTLHSNDSRVVTLRRR